MTRIKNCIHGKWSYGHDNENHRGLLNTRNGEDFTVFATLEYDSKTNNISWGIQSGRHPDWLDTLNQMKNILSCNKVRLAKINCFNKQRYRFIRTGTGRFLSYRARSGKEFILGTPNNDWLVIDADRTHPTDTQSIPLDVLCKMLLPLESYLKSEFNIQ